MKGLKKRDRTVGGPVKGLKKRDRTVGGLVNSLKKQDRPQGAGRDHSRPMTGLEKNQDNQSGGNYEI